MIAVTSATDRYHHGDLPNALRRAAVEVIEERGLGAFSLREVARRAGVSHNAPAHHFGDMRGLLTSLAIEGFEVLHAATTAAAAPIDDPVERLIAIGTAYLDVAKSHRAHCDVMFRIDLVDAEDPALVAAGMRAYGVLEDAVRAVIDADDSASTSTTRYGCAGRRCKASSSSNQRSPLSTPAKAPAPWRRPTSCTASPPSSSPACTPQRRPTATGTEDVQQDSSLTRSSPAIVHRHQTTTESGSRRRSDASTRARGHRHEALVAGSLTKRHRRAGEAADDTCSRYKPTHRCRSERLGRPCRAEVGAGVRSARGARRRLSDACSPRPRRRRLGRTGPDKADSSEQPFRRDVAVGDSGEDIDVTTVAYPPDRLGHRRCGEPMALPRRLRYDVRDPHLAIPASRAHRRRHHGVIGLHNGDTDLSECPRGPPVGDLHRAIAVATKSLVDSPCVSPLHQHGEGRVVTGRHCAQMQTVGQRPIDAHISL